MSQYCTDFTSVYKKSRDFAVLAYLFVTATPFDLLKILITSLDLSTQKTYYSLEKRLDIFYGAEIGTILAYFGPNFVVMATPFAPLEVLLAHLKLPTPNTLLIS